MPSNEIVNVTRVIDDGPVSALQVRAIVLCSLVAFLDGIDSVPLIWPILKTIPWLVGLYLAKIFFSGSSNTSERNMHGKVVMVTVR